MKPIDKKELPKIIAVVVLALALVGYVLFQALGVGAPAPAPVAVASPAAVATGPGAAAAAGAPGADVAPDAAEMGDGGPMPSGGKDPFVENGPASKFYITATPRPAPSVVMIGPARVPGFLLPSNHAGPIVMPAPTPTPGPPPAPPVPTWTVAGIILADRGAGGVKIGRDVAFLRNGGDRMFVRVGDPVGNGYMVAAIHPTGVDIRSGDHITTLGLPGAP